MLIFVEMLPRAAFYFATALLSVESLVQNWPDPENPAAIVPNVADVLFFYFLDIARTWVETRADDWLHGLNEFYFADFLLRPLFASTGDIIAGILAYLDRVIPPPHAGTIQFPNVFAHLITPPTANAIVLARPAVVTRLQNLRRELSELWFRAILGRAFTGAQPDDPGDPAAS